MTTPSSNPAILPLGVTVRIGGDDKTPAPLVTALPGLTVEQTTALNPPAFQQPPPAPPAPKEKKPKKQGTLAQGDRIEEIHPTGGPRCRHINSKGNDRNKQCPKKADHDHGTKCGAHFELAKDPPPPAPPKKAPTRTFAAELGSSGPIKEPAKSPRGEPEPMPYIPAEPSDHNPEEDEGGELPPPNAEDEKALIVLEKFYRCNPKLMAKIAPREQGIPAGMPVTEWVIQLRRELESYHDGLLVRVGLHTIGEVVEGMGASAGLPIPGFADDCVDDEVVEYTNFTLGIYEVLEQPLWMKCAGLILSKAFTCNRNYKDAVAALMVRGMPKVDAERHVLQQFGSSRELRRNAQRQAAGVWPTQPAK